MNQAATYTNAALWTLHERYGELFVFGFGSIRFHWLVGPDALRFVLKEEADAFTLKRAYSFLQPIGGDTALITSDDPEHLARRRLVQPAFHAKRLAVWLERIEERTEAFVASLPPQADFYALVRPHMLRTLGELLLGRETLARLPALVPNIATMMDFANSPFLAQQFKLNVPGLPWWRFVRARRRVDELLYAELERRRNAPPTDDIIGLLLAARDDAGEPLSSAELRDQAISLTSAGFDTTSAALTWAVYLLVEHPAVMVRLRAELEGCSSAQERLKSPFLDAVVKETLRLYPTAPAGLRQARRATIYRGHLIPAGSLVAYSIYVTQRREASFEHALSFRPERWLNGFTPEPFTYAPFGYGARYCIGAQLATILIKLTLAHLVTSCTLSAAWESPPEEAGNTVQPKGGLPLLIHPTD